MSYRVLFALGLCIVVLIVISLLAALLRADDHHDWDQLTNEEWKQGDG